MEVRAGVELEGSNWGLRVRVGEVQRAILGLGVRKWGPGIILESRGEGAGAGGGFVLGLRGRA